MSKEYSDSPSGRDKPDSKDKSNAIPEGARRRYWGASAPSNGAQLPHWTDPPTGEIPKIYGLGTRASGESVDTESADEGALSFKRERRLLESTDQLGTVHSDPAPAGRHFGGTDGELDEDATIDLTLLDRSAPSRQDFSRGDPPLRVISSRPSPLRSRHGRSQRNSQKFAEDTSEIFKPIPGDREAVDSKESNPTGAEAQVEEMVLPERRRPQFSRPKFGAKKSPSEPRAPKEPKAQAGKSEGPPAASASIAIRLVTGLSLGAAVVIAFLLGQKAVLGILTLAILLATVEYYRLVRQEHPSSPKGGYRPAVIVGLIGTVGAVIGAYLKGPSALVLVFSFTLLASFLWYLFGVLKAPVLPNAAITFMGVAWIGLGGGYAAAIIRPISGDPRAGLAYMMTVLIVVVANDVFAYFGGMVFGKRKLAPKISPAKTVEGLLIGAAGAILAGALIASHIHPVTVSLGGTIGVLGAIGGPCGDLVESKIKREIGAKDAGSLLPGHGGMLDRLDALVFVTPLVYYMLYFTHHIA